MEIEYEVRSAGCRDGSGYSCASVTGPYNGGYGHTDYTHGWVTLKTAHLTGGAPLYHHAVNHETGHILGFRDGAGATDCPVSIMHSIAYGCSANYEWPTDGDIWVGTTVANNSATY